MLRKYTSYAGILGLFLLMGCSETPDGEDLILPQEVWISLPERFPELAASSDSLSFDLARLQTGLEAWHPAFPLLYEHVLDYPRFGWSLASEMLRSAKDPEALIYLAFKSLGAPAGGWGPPLSGGELPAALSRGDLDFGPSQEEYWEMLPLSFRRQVLNGLGMMRKATVLLGEFSSPVVEQLSEPNPAFPGSSNPERVRQSWSSMQFRSTVLPHLAAKADLKKLSQASRLLARVLNQFRLMELPLPQREFKSCIFDTSMGRVGIYGPGRDTIKGDFALIIDLGGDDLYLGPILSPVRSPSLIPDREQLVSLLIDLEGNDSYRAKDAHLLFACLGAAMLMDASGSDSYYSDKNGLSSSFFGSSLLFDLAGDDIYHSRDGYSQGAAQLGASLLIDLGGEDQYRSYSFSQAFGGTRGLGVLLDVSGDDRYTPENSATVPSFMQGAARGRWAEFSDGYSLGGGMGLFIDGEGADEYLAGSFSQGASYFTGAGYFFDLKGDDLYQALSHSQGYAAHYSLASFVDIQGEDQYNRSADTLLMTQLMGGGRDQSFGAFFDLQGSDHYYFGNRSLGIGDLNGLGVFWDAKGPNEYTWYRNEVNRGSPSMGASLAPGAHTGISPRFLDVPRGSRLGIFQDPGPYQLHLK